MKFEELKAKLSWMEIKESEWHQHKNGGGWVQNAATVSESCWIEGIVSGDAQVSGDARVFGNARVSGNAQVSGDAWETTPFFIAASRHSVTTCTHTKIQIGCQCLTAEDWLKNYERIGRENGYTPDQIAEYGMILRLASDWLKMKFGTNKPQRDAKGRFVSKN